MDKPFFPPTGKQVVPLSKVQDDERTIIATPTILMRALWICVQKKRASTVVLQNEFDIGYEDAVKLLDQMTEQGFVGKANGSRPRPILNRAYEMLALWDAEEKIREPSIERDELFEDALRICVEMKRASTSVLQRRLRIGYGRAAAILDAMEREGFIGEADGARPRPILSRAYETVGERDE
jgi:DNA segregation ATPase FtsK/SpoIIIE-like protein